MNTLSWFIYLADIVGRLSAVLSVISVAAAVLIVIWFFVAVDWNKTYIKYGEYKQMHVPSLYLTIIPVIFFLFSICIPSKEAIYLIAGSEAGEMVIQDEGTQAIIKDVREVIQLQLQKLKE